MISGPNDKANEAYAERLMPRLRAIAGLADTHIQQASNYPQISVDIDRSRADRIGITEGDVTRSLSVNLAGSLQTAPAFWLNPKNGVSYPIVVQAPPYRADSLADLYNVPVSAGGTAGLQTLSGLGTIHRERTAAVLAHYAASPVTDIYATTQGRDLGAWPPISSACWTAKGRPAQGHHRYPARPGADDEHRLHRAGPGPGGRHRADLPADRGELPELERPGRDHLGPARRAGGHRLDAVRHGTTLRCPR
jgi:hypothetical protein